MPKELRAKALRLARLAFESAEVADHTETYAGIVNYAYWKTRCEVEANRITTDARRYMMLADQFGAEANPEKAKEQYELAWDEWAKIFELYPQLVHDEMGDDLYEVIIRYRLVLDQLDEEFPENFKLEMIMKAREEEKDSMPPDGATSAPPPASQ
jgi:hypothetical protein